MKFSYRKLAMGVLASVMLAGAASAGELLVYSSTDADNLKYYMDNFKRIILTLR